MGMQHISRGIKDWTGTTLVGLLVAAPVALLVLFRPDPQSMAEVVVTSGLLTYALVLGAAVSVYFHWRMTGGGMRGRLSGWLTVGLLIVAINGLVTSALFDATATGASPNRLPLVFQIVLAAVLGTIALVAEHVDLEGDPAFIGAVAGLVLGAVMLLVSVLAEPLVVGPALTALLNTLAMLMGLAVAWIVLQRTSVSLWARRRLALAATTLTAAVCIGNLQVHDYTVLAALTVGANLAGAVVLCTMAQTLLRTSILDHQQELRSMRVTLDEVRAGGLSDRELLHEVGSMIAGIASASQVMRHGPGLTLQQRNRLEEMLEAELSRLQRLMCARAPMADREVRVDQVVEHLVVSHQARGLDVRWAPSGHHVVGDPDELAEVLNILLENATRHGRGKTVTLEVHEHDEFIEIACTDRGPGVAPEIRHRLFGSGVRGPDSGGQGLGLAIARRLLVARGGNLELIDSTTPGATFVARLPKIARTHGAPRYATI